MAGGVGNTPGETQQAPACLRFLLLFYTLMYSITYRSSEGGKKTPAQAPVRTHFVRYQGL